MIEPNAHRITITKLIAAFESVEYDPQAQLELGSRREVLDALHAAQDALSPSESLRRLIRLRQLQQDEYPDTYMRYVGRGKAYSGPLWHRDGKLHNYRTACGQSYRHARMERYHGALPGRLCRTCARILAWEQHQSEQRLSS